MKRYIPITIILVYTLQSFGQGGVAINDNGALPDASAMIDITSTTSGMLIPRMTEVERNAIVTPAQSLLIYQTDLDTGFYYYKGSQWVPFCTATSSSEPVGEIIVFPVATPAAGFLLCDGSAVSRTTYADLFAVLGTSYGAGDGNITFNLPDLRGEFIRGADNGRNVDVGRVIGTSQLDQFQGHHHSLSYPNTGATGGSLAVVLSTVASANIRSNAATTIINDGTNGAPRIGTETRPRNMAMNYCIRH